MQPLTVTTALFTDTISMVAGCSGHFMRIPVRVIIKKHSEIRFRAGEEKRKYQIVSVMQTTPSYPIYSFTDVGIWDEYGEYVNKILSGSLYQTEMGEKIKTELEKNISEEFFSEISVSYAVYLQELGRT